MFRIFLYGHWFLVSYSLVGFSAQRCPPRNSINTRKSDALPLVNFICMFCFPTVSLAVVWAIELVTTDTARWRLNEEGTRTEACYVTSRQCQVTSNSDINVRFFLLYQFPTLYCLYFFASSCVLCIKGIFESRQNGSILTDKLITIYIYIYIRRPSDDDICRSKNIVG
jgi:hypothetical protein